MNRPALFPVILHRQRRVPIDRAQFRRWCREAFSQCLREERWPPDFAAQASVIIVSDRVITQLHTDFLGEPTATDVITFDHGEIVLSAETAAREAAARGLPVEEELLRYAVHGLLHLAGYDDHEPPARRRMHRRQEAVVRAVTRS